MSVPALIPDPEMFRDEHGRVWVSSLEVAKRFCKQHKDVLRAIQGLECSAEFAGRNFAPGEYLDANGQKRPMVRMTRDGFMFLTMGFTGSEAAAWKEKFIDVFNRMENAGNALMASLQPVLRALGEAQVAAHRHTIGRIEIVETKQDNHEARIIQLERERSKRKEIKPSVKNRHYQVLVQTGCRCPMCSAETKAVEYDHMYSNQHADFEHTWPLCKPCHLKLTIGEISRDFADVFFKAYIARARKISPETRQLKLDGFDPDAA